MPLPRVTVFDRLPCEAGAISYPSLRYTRCAIELARGAASTCTLEASLDAVQQSSIRRGRILMLDSPRLHSGRLECVVATVRRRNTAAAVTITTLPLRYLLRRRSFVRDGTSATASYTVPALDLPARRVLERFVLPFAPFPWLLGVRQVDFAGSINIGALTRANPDQVCDLVERETQQLVVLSREDSADGTPLGYWLELLEDPGLAAPVLPGYVDGDVLDIEETDSLPDTITSVLGVADTGALMGETAWRVIASETSSPAWAQLRDPSGGEPPVLEDGQFVGAWIRLSDGAALPILASRGADSAVQLARPVPVGALVGLVATQTGQPIREITSPSGIAAVGVLQGEATVARSRTERNFLNYADLQQGLTGWSHVGAPPRGRIVARSRRDPVEVLGTVQSAASAGALALSLDALPPGPIHRGDPIRIDAWVATTGAGVPTAAGVVTLAITPAIPAGGIADGVPIPLRGPDGSLRSTQADGAQAAGAGTIQLRGLPIIPALATGQTVTVTEGASVAWTLLSGGSGSGEVTYNCRPVDQLIAAGVSVAVSETWRYWDDVSGTGFYVERITTFTTSGTLVSTYVPGDAALTIDFGGLRNPPISSMGGPEAEFLSGSFGRDSTVTRTYTIDVPAAWDGAQEAVVTLTSPIVQAQPVNAAGSVSGVGAVILPAGAATGAMSVRLKLLAAVAVASGSTVTLPGQTAWVAEAQQVPTSSTLTLALLDPLSSAVPAGRPVRIIRVRDLAADEPGSDTTLQFDAIGVGATLPVQLRSAPIQLPVDPATPITARARIGVTTGGAPSAALATGRWQLSGLGSAIDQFVVPPQVGDELLTLHHTLNASEALTATVTRQITIAFSCTISGADRLDARLRYAMLTLSNDAAVPFTIDSFSNRLHQRCQAVLAARSDPTRYVVQGRALDALLDRLGTDRVVIGQRIRIRDAVLGRDVERRIQSYRLAFAVDPSGRTSVASTIEAGTLDPRLSRVTVTA
jgi:hypothetical protein